MAEPAAGTGGEKSVQFDPNVPPQPTIARGPGGQPAQSSVGACDACRARKVRCLANESSMSSKCQRCVRAGRECVYTAHSKTRRRKRTDTRVKELEEKVKNLSMLLENRNLLPGERSTSTEDRGMEYEDDEESPNDEGSEPFDAITPPTGDGNLPGHLAFASSGTGLSGVGAQTAARIPEQRSTRSQTGPLASGSLGGQLSEMGSIVPDVVDRGMLTMEKATELFDRYVNVLCPNYPAVVFPQGTTATEVRKTKPILFLAVIAAAAGNEDPCLNLSLNQEILQVYANKVALQGRKSLELVQSILLSTLWYYPPDRFEELKFHQYIHMAATMALDIGLGKRPRAPRGTQDMPDFTLSAGVGAQQSVGHNGTVPQNPSIDSTSLESRRTLLAAYISCASVSMSLRLPNMLRFTSWMADCLHVLETSPEAAPTDKRFAAWLRIQRIVEECVASFSLDDPGNVVSLADDRVQHLLKAYEKQMDAWRKDLAPGVLDEFLEVNYHVTNVYIHEIALYPEHDAEDFRPPFFVANRPPLAGKSLGPAYANAIVECVSSSQALLKTFLGMKIDTIRALPALLYVRVIYSTIVLIKLDVSAKAPSSELGKIMDRNSLQVRPFLDNTFKHLTLVVGNENKNILSAKFLVILSKLRKWYLSQSTQCNPTAGEIGGLEPGRYFEKDKAADFSILSQSDPTPIAEPGIGDHQTVTEMLQSKATFRSFQPFSGIPQQPSSSFVKPLHDLTDSPTVPTTGIPDPYTWAGQTYAKQGTSSANNSSPEYADPAGSTLPLDFPMEVDANMFTHLQDADPFSYTQDPNDWMFDGIDYANMPDFDWSSLGPQ